MTPKSSLPEWVAPISCSQRCPCSEKGEQFRQAISLAWEALECISIDDPTYSQHQLAQIAMDAIRKLGGKP